MNEDIRTRIALSLVPNIGAHRSRVLMEQVDRPSDVFRLSKDELLGIRGFGAQVVRQLLSFNRWKEVDAVIKRTEKLGASIIIPEDDVYPSRLREIADPPVVLWVKGNVSLLESAGIAVVGTRSPSPYGRDMAARFSRELVESGLSVISGLAYGIDTVAHRTALQSGGKTVAVLGSGIDRIYPVQNTPLADRIIKEDGVIISEFPPGTKPDYMNFPTRNRVVSGLALGVLIVETGTDGGSMITARLALDQSREVFVVPHNLTSTRAGGCHKLIRESSGKLVEVIEDITSEFSWLQPVLTTSAIPQEIIQPEGLSSIAEDCWKRIQAQGGCSVDELMQVCPGDPGVVLGALMEMEIYGHIRQRPGNRYELANVN